MTIQRVAALVSTQWLKQMYVPNAVKTAASAMVTDKKDTVFLQPSDPLRILDTSWLPEPHVDGYKEFYRQGHIPGSMYFDLKKLSPKRPDSPIDCPIPDPGFFTEYVQSRGITNDTHVIVYDSLNARPSVRAWFLFHLFGHKKVSILNGGLRHWEKDGLPVTKAEPHLETNSEFKVNLNSELLLDYGAMLKIVESEKFSIVDTRPREGGFYITDEDKSGGHMPGAKSVPFTEFFDERDNSFKSKEQLEELLSSSCVDLSKPVVATCQRGMTACAAILALHILGQEGVPLYNGSWLEWSAIAPADKMVKVKNPSL